MVLDRGGLRYPIEVIDLFSKNLQKFRSEIRAARTEFISFRRSSRAATAQAGKQEVLQRREAATAAKESAKASRERAQEVAAGARQLKQVQDLRARMFKTERVEREKAEKAADRAAKAQKRAAVQAAAASRKAASSQTKLRVKTQQTDSAAQKLLFTFRRLVGVLALFTIARQVAQGFSALVKTGFAFNQTVERTRLGIAGIIVAVGQVRNEQGRLLKGAEAFTAATVAARRQQLLLRQDALSTVATFQELLDAFQIALGPGLAAGFNLDQVRKFSVLISQAASNIGLPQRQLSEEIRAILTGNIRQTTTRIAQVLNLTNSEIRELKAQGPSKFFQALQQRLEGFAIGAKAAATTLGGLFVRLKDVVELVAGTSAKSAFDKLTVTLKELFEALTVVVTKTDVGKLLAPDPQAQEAFAAIFDSIEAILDRAKVLGRTIGLKGVTDAAKLLGNVLESVGAILLTILTGAVRGFGALQRILEPVVAGFTAIFDALPTGAANELFTTLAQMATVLFSLKIGFLLLSGTAGRILKFFIGWPVQLGLSLLKINNIVEGTKIWVRDNKIIAVTMKVIKTRAFLVAGAIALAVFASAKLLSSILGIKLELADLPKVVGAAMERAFTQIRIFADKVKLGGLARRFIALGETVRDELKNALSPEQFKFIEKLQPEDLLNLPAFAKALRPAKGETASKEFLILQGIVKTLRETEGFGQKLIRLGEERNALELELQELKSINAQTEDDANATLDERIKKLREEIAERERLAKEILKAAQEEKPGRVDAKKPLSESTKLAIGILTSAVQDFATFVSDAIVDAFDPTKDTDLKERFARFLQGIAKMILQTFIKLAIQKAILFAFFPGGAPSGLFGTVGAGKAKGGPIGRRKGGRIPGRASAQHYSSPQGLRAGGSPKTPKGISRKDNVPIWAQKGEFMMRLSAVQKYGITAMESLNRGLVDPGALASMAGAQRLSQNTRRTSGYAAGGSILPVPSPAERPAASSGAGDSVGLGATLLVANDTTADRLLAGGSKAVLDFIDEHGADIEGRLSRFRS